MRRAHLTAITGSKGQYAIWLGSLGLVLPDEIMRHPSLESALLSLVPRDGEVSSEVSRNKIAMCFDLDSSAEVAARAEVHQVGLAVLSSLRLPNSSLVIERAVRYEVRADGQPIGNGVV